MWLDAKAESVAAGADWDIFNAPSSWQRRDVQLLYGSNDVFTGRPSLLLMAGGILTFPPFVVQVCLRQPTHTAE